MEFIKRNITKTILPESNNSIQIIANFTTIQYMLKAANNHEDLLKLINDLEEILNVEPALLDVDALKSRIQTIKGNLKHEK